MLSKNCGLVDIRLLTTCVKNLTVPTTWLLYLPIAVFFNRFLTQLMSILPTTKISVIHQLIEHLYTKYTPPTIKTIYLILFSYYFCNERIVI